MATVKRDGLPEFWSTGLAKALVGEQACELEAWAKGHYRIKRQGGESASLAQWKIDHTAQLQAATERLRADGWKCQVEQWFRLQGQFAVITGKTDLITQKEGCRPVIRDTKGGEPRDSDVAQVLIYMVVLPLVWKSPKMQFAGEVIYPDHSVSITPPEAEAVKKKLFDLVRRLSMNAPPPANPSESACRFCDVPESLCNQRWMSESTVVNTDLF